MRATALEVTETTALVELRPCWLARLFGARTVVAELWRRGASSSWETKNTGTAVTHVEHGPLILRALDFRPRAQLPRAEVRT